MTRQQLFDDNKRMMQINEFLQRQIRQADKQIHEMRLEIERLKQKDVDG